MTGENDKAMQWLVQMGIPQDLCEAGITEYCNELALGDYNRPDCGLDPSELYTFVPWFVGWVSRCHLQDQLPQKAWRELQERSNSFFRSAYESTTKVGRRNQGSAVNSCHAVAPCVNGSGGNGKQ